MMRVLVTAATKYGATGEIARAIGEVLAEHGLDPAAVPPQQVDRLDGYDAVVLGSAVYAGHWVVRVPEGRFVIENSWPIPAADGTARGVVVQGRSPAAGWRAGGCSASVISWLLARGGLPTDAIHPPPGGRAPGWAAGLAIAHRSPPRAHDPGAILLVR
jgi:Flavodoxin domain